MKFHPDSVPKSSQKHRKRIKVDALNGLLLTENFTPGIESIANLLSDRGLAVEKLVNAAKKSLFRRSNKRRDIFAEETGFQSQWSLDEHSHEFCQHEGGFCDRNKRFCHQHLDTGSPRHDETSEFYSEDESQSMIETRFSIPDFKSYRNGTFGSSMSSVTSLSDLDYDLKWLTAANKTASSMYDLDMPEFNFNDDQMNYWIRCTHAEFEEETLAHGLRTAVPKIAPHIPPAGDTRLNFHTDVGERYSNKINDSADSGDECHNVKCTREEIFDETADIGEICSSPAKTSSDRQPASVTISSEQITSHQYPDNNASSSKTAHFAELEISSAPTILSELSTTNRNLDNRHGISSEASNTTESLMVPAFSSTEFSSYKLEREEEDNILIFEMKPQEEVSTIPVSISPKSSSDDLKTIEKFATGDEFDVVQLPRTTVSISTQLPTSQLDDVVHKNQDEEADGIVLKMRINDQKLGKTNDKTIPSFDFHSISQRIFQNNISVILKDVCERVINHLLSEDQLYSKANICEKERKPSEGASATVKIESMSELGNGVINYKNESHLVNLPPAVEDIMSGAILDTVTPETILDTVTYGALVDGRVTSRTMLDEVTSVEGTLASAGDVKNEEKSDPWKIFAKEIKELYSDDPEKNKRGDEPWIDKAAGDQILVGSGETASSTRAISHDIAQLSNRTRDQTPIRRRRSSNKVDKNKKSRSGTAKSSDTGSSDLSASESSRGGTTKYRGDGKRSKASCSLRNVSRSCESSPTKSLIGKNKTVCRKPRTKYTSKETTKKEEVKPEKKSGGKKTVSVAGNLQLGRRPVFPPVQVRPQKRSQPLIIPDEFTRRFQELAKYTDPLKTGVVITKTLSTTWLKEAKILDERVTEDEVNHIFSIAAGQRLVLNIHDYLRYLTKVSLLKNMRLNDLIGAMMKCKISVKKGKMTKKKERFQPQPAGPRRKDSEDSISTRGTSLPNIMEY